MAETDIWKEYAETRQIASYETGEQSTLKLSSFLRICQDVSERHLALWGLPYEKLKEDGLVFLFARNGVSVSRMPFHREKVRVSTSPHGSLGAQFYRSYTMTNAETGEVLAELNQASVIVDASTHKILRPRIFSQYGVQIGETDGRFLEKIEVPEGMPLVGERPVYYSDLDYNGHLNNAIYADILCDFIPGGMMGQSLKEVQINYSSECRFGDVLKLYAKEQDGAVYLCGEHERGGSFVCRAVKKGK